ncbi:MAG: hypothetical protein ABIW84_04405 [Ilumatobacteraceae bacterium]
MITDTETGGTGAGEAGTGGAGVDDVGLEGLPVNHEGRPKAHVLAVMATSATAMTVDVTEIDSQRAIHGERFTAGRAAALSEVESRGAV